MSIRKRIIATIVAFVVFVFWRLLDFYQYVAVFFSPQELAARNEPWKSLLKQMLFRGWVAYMAMAFLIFALLIIWLSEPIVRILRRRTQAEKLFRRFGKYGFIDASWGEGVLEDPKAWLHDTIGGRPLIERTKYLLTTAEGGAAITTNFRNLEMPENFLHGTPKKLRLTYPDGSIIFIHDGAPLRIDAAAEVICGYPAKADQPSEPKAEPLSSKPNTGATPDKPAIRRTPTWDEINGIVRFGRDFCDAITATPKNAVDANNLSRKAVEAMKLAYSGHRRGIKPDGGHVTVSMGWPQDVLDSLRDTDGTLLAIANVLGWYQHLQGYSLDIEPHATDPTATGETFNLANRLKRELDTLFKRASAEYLKEIPGLSRSSPNPATDAPHLMVLTDKGLRPLTDADPPWVHLEAINTSSAILRSELSRIADIVERHKSPVPAAGSDPVWIHESSSLTRYHEMRIALLGEVQRQLPDVRVPILRDFTKGWQSGTPLPDCKAFSDELLEIEHQANRKAVELKGKPTPINKDNQGRVFEVWPKGSLGDWPPGSIFSEYDFRKRHPTVPAPPPGTDPVVEANEYYNGLLERHLSTGVIRQVS